MRIFLVISALALAGGLSTTSATAAPIGNTKVESLPSAMEQVHYRSYRHCHWRHGERWCHSGEPSVYLEFGNYRRRHHHGDHDHGDRDHGNRDHGDRDHGDHHDGGKKKY